MFTGIIQEVGHTSAAQPQGGSVRLTIRAPHSTPQLSVNDSIAINGVCQTVVAKRDDEFTVEAVEETLKKTTLGGLSAQTPVNLELPLRLNDRLGGHLLLGHVDGVGVITSIRPLQNSSLYDIKMPEQFLRYVIPAGSIAVDGVSLTVARLSGYTISVSIIPHTMTNTIFHRYTKGTTVNLEFDLIGKYIERFGAFGRQQRNDITAERLREWGYEE